MTPEPTIRELIDAAGKAVKGSASKVADYIVGSDNDVFAGVGAMLWSRQAQRDTDLFLDRRFATASGKKLEQLVFGRFGIERVKDTRGIGTAILKRANGAAGAGTIWSGTQIRLSSSSPGLSKIYRVRTSKTVSASELIVTVEIEAEGVGTGWATNSTEQLTVLDPLWDNSWTVSSLICADGTNFETAEEFKARVVKERIDARVGQTEAITKICKDAGAGQVQLFRSDFAGLGADRGLNVCYVGDSGYTGTPELVRACLFALRKGRVAGDNLQVLPMQRVSLDVTATVFLVNGPDLSDTGRLYQVHRAAISQYLGGSAGGFTYSRVGITSAIARHTPEVQDVSIETPSSDQSVISGGNFPEVLSRFVLRDVKLTYKQAA